MRNIWREPKLETGGPDHLPEGQMLLLEAFCLSACHLGPMMPSKRKTTEWEGSEQSISSHPQFLIVWHRGKEEEGGYKVCPQNHIFLMEKTIAKHMALTTQNL